jgi:hypothetical protein
MFSRRPGERLNCQARGLNIMANDGSRGGSGDELPLAPHRRQKTRTASAKRIVARLALTSDEPALGRFFNAQGNLMTTLVLFAHGKESGPWGAKIRSLAKVAERLGAIVESPSYEGMDDADEGHVGKVESLGNHLCAHQDINLPGPEVG